MQEERKRLERLRVDANRSKEVFELLRKEQWGYFKRFDTLLDRGSTGPHWLKKPEVAEIVKEGIHYRDGKVYNLIVYSIMPNHVHMIVDLSIYGNPVRRVAGPTPTENQRHDSPVRRADCPTNKYPLTEILRKLKWNTALRANRALHCSGPFWQDESYDHIIRDDAELERTIWYVLQNPVNAGLTKTWEQWPWNYCKWSLE